MKNKKVLIAIVFVIILLTTFVLFGFNHFYKNNSNDTNKELENGTTISMFFEQTENTGDYVEAVADGWPVSGYVFNSNMSYCENDSELTWENNKVKVKAYVKDKCYVYFDKVTYYWNDNFSYSSYQIGNTPTIKYTTLEQLQSNYSDFSNKPLYIKTTDKHEACSYGSNEFCLGANYWDTDATTTLNKILDDLENKLGVNPNMNVNTGVGNNNKYVWARSYNITYESHSNGSVVITNGTVSCSVGYDGSAYCYSGSYS